jgi:glycerol-3-phosphate acyltransferase PlsY
MIHATLAITSAYLMGCFNTGYYLVRMKTGQDIRTLASGGSGSRNVGRLLGTKGFVITLIGDAGKGMAAIWLARYLALEPWQFFCVLLAVTAGHIFPAQLGFRGGKGFATLAGGLLLLAPTLLLTGFLLSVLILLVVRRTTKAGLLALACTPLIMVIERSRSGQPWLSPESGIYCLLVVMVLYAHRSNIRKEFFISNTDTPKE